jgi:hypothetical protein
MDTSPTSFLSEILEGIEGKEIPKHKLAYFRARLRSRIYDLVVSEFDQLQKQENATKADLARRIGRDAALISRWLSAPSNWTLDTISDLLIAMASEPKLGIDLLKDKKLEAPEEAPKMRRYEIPPVLDASMVRMLQGPVGGGNANNTISNTNVNNMGAFVPLVNAVPIPSTGLGASR